MVVDLAPVRALKTQGGSIATLSLPAMGDTTIQSAYPLADAVRRDRHVRLFSALRDAHAESFFDPARPSVEAVRTWVETRYDSDDHQINFVLERGDGEGLLFLGLTDIDPGTGRAEFGRLMRAGTAPRGLAAAALPHLFLWAAAVGLRTLYLEVFADNLAARRLYERVGFRLEHTFLRVPVAAGGRTMWERGSGTGARPVAAMELALRQPSAPAEVPS